MPTAAKQLDPPPKVTTVVGAHPSLSPSSITDHELSIQNEEIDYPATSADGADQGLEELDEVVIPKEINRGEIKLSRMSTKDFDYDSGDIDDDENAEDYQDEEEETADYGGTSFMNNTNRLDSQNYGDPMPENTGFFQGENIKHVAQNYKDAKHLDTSTGSDDCLKRASVVLDVVSWLCDGQNREMQETLRQQGFAFSNVNIVAEICVVIQSLAEHMNLKNMSVTKKAIQALIEMCAGNHTNQETAFKGQIVDSVNTILQVNVIEPTDEEVVQVLEVRASAIELLEVMLEETHENSRHLAQGISDDLSVPTLLHVMLEITRIGNDNEKLSSKSKRAVFGAYHVIKKIAYYLNVTVNDYVEQKSPKFLSKPDAASMWLHLGNWSRSIEVNYVTKDKKEILTQVYFPYNPSKELSDPEKDIVEEKIVRSSPEDKFKDFLGWMESIRKNIRHREYVNRNPRLAWAAFLSGPRHITLLILTFLLNLFMLFLFDVPQDILSSSEDPNSSNNASVEVIENPDIPSWYSPLLYIVGIFYCLMALWMMIEYFVLEAKNIRMSIPLIQKWLWNFKKYAHRRHFLMMVCRDINKIFCGGRITINPPSEEAQFFEVYFLSFAPLYRIFFFICSVLALFTHGYFYCGCLLYLFLRSVVLRQVLTAVRRSALQLIVVGLLALAVLMVYAVISFAVLHNFFDPDENLFCNSLWQCFVSVTREGLLDTLGATLPVRYVGQEGSSFTIYAVRTIFDLSFFIIITTLGLNIVVAVLVDRFSELRSEKDAINKDQSSYCFICGIDSDTFESKAKGFRHHVHNDHSKWNYIYFVLHLDSLYANDHNALEKYVFDNIQAKKITFFPIRKAKVLENRN